MLLYNKNGKLCTWQPDKKESCLPFEAETVKKAGNKVLALSKDLETLYLIDVSDPEVSIEKEFRISNGKIWRSINYLTKTYLFKPFLKTENTDVFFVKNGQEFSVCKLHSYREEQCIPIGGEKVYAFDLISPEKVWVITRGEKLKIINFKTQTVKEYKTEFPILVDKGESKKGNWFLFLTHSLERFGGNNGFIYISPDKEIGREGREAVHRIFHIKRRYLLPYLISHYPTKDLLQSIFSVFQDT
jgi:hypothetical protein